METTNTNDFRDGIYLVKVARKTTDPYSKHEHYSERNELMWAIEPEDLEDESICDVLQFVCEVHDDTEVFIDSNPGTDRHAYVSDQYDLVDDVASVMGDEEAYYDEDGKGVKWSQILADTSYNDLPDVMQGVFDFCVPDLYMPYTIGVQDVTVLHSC